MPRRGNTTILHVTVEEIAELSFDEVCAACQVSPDFVMELIAYGTIEPEGFSTETWRFDATHIHTIRTAMHLHHDLEVNHAGIALAIDLINQIEELRTGLDLLKRYFSQNSRG